MFLQSEEADKRICYRAGHETIGVVCKCAAGLRFESELRIGIIIKLW